MRRATICLAMAVVLLGSLDGAYGTTPTELVVKLSAFNPLIKDKEMESTCGTSGAVGQMDVLGNKYVVTFDLSKSDLKAKTGSSDCRVKFNTEMGAVAVVFSATRTLFRSVDWKWECQSDKVLCQGQSGGTSPTFFAGDLRKVEKKYTLTISFDRAALAAPSVPVGTIGMDVPMLYAVGAENNGVENSVKENSLVDNKECKALQAGWLDESLSTKTVPRNFETTEIRFCGSMRPANALVEWNSLTPVHFESDVLVGSLQVLSNPNRGGGKLMTYEDKKINELRDRYFRQEGGKGFKSRLWATQLSLRFKEPYASMEETFIKGADVTDGLSYGVTIGHDDFQNLGKVAQVVAKFALKAWSSVDEMMKVQRVDTVEELETMVRRGEKLHALAGKYLTRMLGAANFMNRQRMADTCPYDQEEMGFAPVTHKSNKYKDELLANGEARLDPRTQYTIQQWDKILDLTNLDLTYSKELGVHIPKEAIVKDGKVTLKLQGTAVIKGKEKEAYCLEFIRHIPEKEK